MDGIVNLLKPPGMTSHDCVYALRRMCGQKKVGHSGTLDPNACGVLPLFIGNATRLIEYTENTTKKYRCEMLLGIVTDTQDIWGNILNDNRATMNHVSKEAVLSAFLNFLGPIRQTPPNYSAVKVNGKRLYQYAREGTTIKVDERIVTVNQISLIRFLPDVGRLIFDVECSKGTYVRTICHDLGNLLGCGACMSFLLRTSASGFCLENSKTLEELSAMSSLEFENALLSPIEAVKSLQRISLTPKSAELFLNGNKSFQHYLLPVEQSNGNEENLFSVFLNNEFLGIAVYIKNEGYKILKVFKG
ncbi:MAG: tRNA pseudouridine(55) synthase TruB [Clostridia bacterium]|nr:tRNA pseudouridine(55) synthase TruB [Clostridia bacterium]